MIWAALKPSFGFGPAKWLKWPLARVEHSDPSY